MRVVVVGNKAALYVRVSTADKGQDVAVQEGPLREWVERLGYETVVFAESGVSGAKTSRRVLDEMMKAVRRREVQAVAVWRLDRLGRSLQHLLQLLQEIESHGGRLLIHDMALDTGTIQGKLFFSMIGALAEYERGLIAERVKDGLVHAKRHGTKSGRPIGRPNKGINIQDVCNALLARAGEPSLIANLAREFGCSRAWIYKTALPLVSKQTAVQAATPTHTAASVPAVAPSNHPGDRCPRCGGNVFPQNDMDGRWLSCLQCGWRAGT